MEPTYMEATEKIEQKHYGPWYISFNIFDGTAA